jgi:hypothetical protein
MKDKTATVFLKYILEVAKSKYKEQRTRKYELKEYLVSFMKALKMDTSGKDCVVLTINTNTIGKLYTTNSINGRNPFPYQFYRACFLTGATPASHVAI